MRSSIPVVSGRSFRGVQSRPFRNGERMKSKNIVSGRVTRYFVIVLALVVSLAPSLLAQATTATILGTVTDMSGAAVSDAAIQVKNVATGVTQNSVSDS